LSKKYFQEKQNHVEFSVSSAISVFETFSVSFLGISTLEVLDTSSVVDTTGEFRCCSSSYSLINRFLSECALFDEFGDATIGGVVLVLVNIGFVGGLFKLDE
jgi:hypothetical protein